MSLVYIDAKGDKQAVDLSVSLYKDAADAGQSLPQLLANKYPTNADKHGSTYEQLMEQCGVFVKGSKEFGIRASTMQEVLAPKEANGLITREGIPASRILFPATILGIIENKLAVDLTSDADAFDSLVAQDDTIATDKFERPVLNFSEAEKGRSAPVAQLAKPQTMLSITASDKSMRIPTWGIGMEISEQALASTPIDLVGLAMARQAAVERNERAHNFILSLLNGDVDLGMAALSTIGGKVVAAASLDDAATTGITHKAWIKWLGTNSKKRKITHVVTDVEGMLAIEQRAGRPNANDNIQGVTQRTNTLFNVAIPKWESDVTVILIENAAWPAGTIMGVDARYGVHRVSSLMAQYSAIEQFALRRATALRVDSGEMAYRLFDEAFEVLTYA
jgi:hypothetical protein